MTARSQPFVAGWPDAIVFDLDGTIADTAADIRHALNCVLQAAGFGQFDVDTVKIMVGAGPKELVRRALSRLGVAADKDTVSRLAAAFEDEYRQRGNTLSAPFDDVESCLEQLADYQIRMGVCSNKPDKLCKPLLSDLGILGYFSAVQGYGSGLPKKPDPQPLLATLSSLDATPDRALYVGDSETDVQTARAAGVPVAVVSHGYTVTPASELGADWVLTTLAELPVLCMHSKLA
jgi:phosphoglycolate phosphatase